MENIKLKFNNEGQPLDAILIQIAKIKLNSVHIDLLYSNDVKHDVGASIARPQDIDK